MYIYGRDKRVLRMVKENPETSSRRISVAAGFNGYHINIALIHRTL